MASTYSTNLALELIGTGDQSGTWGVTTNTNLGTLLEQSISGYVTQAITDGSGANTTITIPNGATGVARNMFIEMTGALTFSTTSLIVPANKKLYFIYNNTTGGFAVTVKVSGLTGVSVPNGAKMVLTSNGTDIVVATNYLASLTLGAALPVASGGTGLTAGTSGGIPAYTATGTITSSAALTQYGVVYGGGAGAVPVATAAGTTGQILTATTGSAPTWATPAAAAGVPAGSVMPFAGSSAPTGYLLCYGQAVSRSTYSDLFAVTSTTYGVGDGTTTFNLPDLRGRLAAGVDNMGGTAANRITSGGSGITGTTLGAAGGAETVALTTAQLASHTHTDSGHTHIENVGARLTCCPGSRYPEQSNASSIQTLASVISTASGNASLTNTGSGTAHNNTQPTMMLNYIIKT